MNDPKPDDKNAFRFSLWRLLASLAFAAISMFCVIIACANAEDRLDLLGIFSVLAVIFLVAAVGVLYRQCVNFVTTVVLWIVEVCFGA